MFYIFIFGIFCGIIISYSPLITLTVGIFLGLSYNNDTVFSYITNIINNFENNLLTPR
jgi:hypothetical protein